MHMSTYAKVCTVHIPVCSVTLQNVPLRNVPLENVRHFRKFWLQKVRLHNIIYRIKTKTLRHSKYYLLSPFQSSCPYPPSLFLYQIKVFFLGGGGYILYHAPEVYVSNRRDASHSSLTRSTKDKQQQQGL
jgi:hypothetical protein